MHAMAINAMIQAWSEGVILTGKPDDKIHLTYSNTYKPSVKVLKLLRYYQPTIARVLPRETVT